MRRERLRRASLGLLGTLLCLEQAVAQVVHYVDNVRDCAGLAPCHATVTDAVNAAAPLDTIEVFPGVYHEAVSVSSRDHIVVKAHDPSLKPAIVAPPGANNAITVKASMGLQILDLILEAPEAAGVHLSLGSSQAVIGGNLVRSLKGIIFDVGAFTQNAVTGNTFVDGGISFPRGAGGNLIEANTFHQAGIRLQEDLIGVGGNVIRRNVLTSGGVRLSGYRVVVNNIVEGNVLTGIAIYANGGVSGAADNAVRHNVVRGADGISLRGIVERNLVEHNFVSGSSGDGILVEHFILTGPTVDGGNIIRGNTSVGNAGCDLNDSGTHVIPNLWEQNRFVTACGAATDVERENHPPLADAGADQAVEADGPDGARVALDGSGSSDPDGDPLAFAWSWPGSGATGARPIVTLPLGTTTVTLQVNDPQGATAADSVEVTVRDTIAPDVALPSPEDGETVSGTINVTASASDRVGVAGVQFLLDEGVLGPEDTWAPYEVPWDTRVVSDGTQRLAARARDAAGNVAISAPVMVTVANGPVPSLALARHEESAATLEPAWAWTRTTTGEVGVGLSGSEAVYASAAGATAGLTFTGTGVRWIGFPCERCGIAEVLIDGTRVATVDTYDSTRPEFSRVMYTSPPLSVGSHTLVIQVTGDANTSSAGAFVVVDAIDVFLDGAGALPPLALPSGPPGALP